MKNAVFCDVTPCDHCRRDIYEERIASIIRVTANVVLSSLILFALMMEGIRSSESLDLTSTIRRHIPQDGILHIHRREKLKSYLALTGWAL
jgi:hypothetical protein